MKKVLYYIDCVTNLHVGSGDVNFNIVDQEVEKDPILGYPIIHSSGIKGALRTVCDEDLAKKVFGSPCAADSVGNAGSYRFFNADLLYRPMRAVGKSPSVKVTSQKMIENFIDMLKNFDIALPAGLENFKGVEFGENVTFLVSNSEITSVEGENVAVLDENTKDCLTSILGEDFAIVKDFADFDLPVIARNNLQMFSGGLWYEEFVPRGSRFYMLVLVPDDDEVIDKVIPELVQIGGNSSIGYGYCHFTRV